MRSRWADARRTTVRRFDDHFRATLHSTRESADAPVAAERESGRPALREGRFKGLPLWYHAGGDAPVTSVLRTSDGDAFDVDDAVACLQFEHYVGDPTASDGDDRRLRQLYYLFKPLLPRAAQLELQRVNARRRLRTTRFPAWPEDATLAQLLLAFLGERMKQANLDRVPFIGFWPHGKTWAWCLTHDVETRKGQARLGPMATAEENRGLGSSWNFVPEDRYKIDRRRMEALRNTGHEIGVHGLNHSGQLFSSRDEFQRSCARINTYAREWNAVGFRSPATYRNPFWLPEIDVEYDTSFMDNATLEPQRGGVCASYPFMLSERMVELPITLPMDHTLINVLRLEVLPAFASKLAWIRRQHGLALALFHPDYNLGARQIDRYGAVLDLLRDEPDGWFALPGEIASWWRTRRESQIAMRSGQPVIEGPAAASGRIWWAERDDDVVRILPG